jgi:hypothetical protein
MRCSQIITSDDLGTYCIIPNRHQWQYGTSDDLGFQVSVPVSKLDIQFWNWTSQIGTVTIWDQKRSSFETRWKIGSSFKTGSVTIWVLTYTSHVYICWTLFCTVLVPALGPSSGTGTITSPKRHCANLGHPVLELGVPVLELGVPVLELGSKWFCNTASSGTGPPVPELGTQCWNWMSYVKPQISTCPILAPVPK